MHYLLHLKYLLRYLLHLGASKVYYLQSIFLNDSCIQDTPYIIQDTPYIFDDHDKSHCIWIKYSYIHCIYIVPIDVGCIDHFGMLHCHYFKPTSKTSFPILIFKRWKKSFTQDKCQTTQHAKMHIRGLHSKQRQQCSRGKNTYAI